MNDHDTTSDRYPDLQEQDGQGDGKKPGLPKPPLFTSDYIAMAEILEFALDRFGKLVLALMYYTTDGTMPDDLPPDLKMMFGIYQRKVDAAREKYGHVCAVRAQNGAKGGKAKAENAKKKSGGTMLSHPTQKQFHEAVQHFVDTGDVPKDISNYAVDSFFDELKSAGWTIGGAPIQSRVDWEAAIRAKFYRFGNSLPDHFYYMIFSAAFVDVHDGEKADDIACDLMDTYNEPSRCWLVQGEQFPTVKWKDALALLIDRYDGSSKS